MECSLTKIRRKVGDKAKILHVNTGLGRQIDRTEDPRKSEHVLRFQERPIAIAVDFDSHCILSLGAQIAADVEGSQ